MTLTLELHPDIIKENQHAIHLESNVIYFKCYFARLHRTHTGPIALPGPLNWSVNVMAYSALAKARVSEPANVLISYKLRKTRRDRIIELRLRLRLS